MNFANINKTNCANFKKKKKLNDRIMGELKNQKNINFNRFSKNSFM